MSGYHFSRLIHGNKHAKLAITRLKRKEYKWSADDSRQRDGWGKWAGWFSAKKLRGAGGEVINDIGRRDAALVMK
jgi:hypothetical protein